MSSDQTHVILARTFHVGVARADAASDVMDSVSDLWEAELAAATDDVFSSCCPAERRVQLESIALDLGTIPAADLAHQLPIRYREALRDALQRLIPHAPTEEPNSEAVGQDSTLAVLEHVLLHGTLPWWCADPGKFEPARKLARLLDRAPAAVASLARRIGRRQPVRIRIVDWLSDPEIGSLIRALIGEDAKFVLRYAKDLDRRQQEKRIVPTSTANFRRVKWEIILAHLLADRGSRFNAKEFLRQTLYSLAARFRLRYDVLLGELARVARAQPRAWGDASLPNLLIELHTENEQAAEKSSSPPRVAEDLEELRQLWQAALRESPTQWSRARRTELAFWRRLPPMVSWHLFAGLSDHPALAAHIAALCSPEEITRLCQLFRFPIMGGGLVPIPLTFPLVGLANGLEAAPADHPVARWIDLWYHLIVEGHAGPDDARFPPTRLAFWRTLPTAQSAEVVTALLNRHGLDAIVAQLAADFSASERANLVQTLLGAARTDNAGEIRRLIAALAELDTGEASDDIAHSAGPPTPDTEIHALRHYLETGELPKARWTVRWQVRREDWLRLTLTRHADLTPGLLHSWTRTEGFTESMSQHLPDPALAVIAEAVEPAHAEEIRRFIDLAARLRPTGRFAHILPTAFSRSAWKLTFDYLLAEQRTEFNAATFLDRAVRGLAHRHGVPADDILSFLIASAEITGRNTLLFQLRGLALRHSSESGGPTGNSSSDSALPAAKATAIARDADESTGHPPASAPSPETKLPTDGDAPRFDAALLRRSALARLQLLRLTLANDPRSQTPATLRLLPLLWQSLANDKAGAWSELLRDPSWSLASIDTALQAGAAPALESVIFRGQPKQAQLWRESLDWLESSPEAATLFPTGRDGLRERLWRALVESWRAGGGRPIEDVATLLARLLGAPGQPGGLAARTAAGLALWREALERDRSASATKLASRLAAAAQRIAAARPDSSRPLPGPPNLRSSHDARETDASRFGPLAVGNAGLVILAPFFGELFRRCDLLVDGVLRDAHATEYAVHLLQFLVAEKRHASEHLLTLNKILCGLAPEAPVLARMELREEDREQGRLLLANVARQWPRGAAISVDGLRASYLRRDGQLERKDFGWLLRVERRGWDVLLAELAWSFPGPQPKWMPVALRVDWI